MPNCNIHVMYMNIAKEISAMSYAQRLKVGAILVKENSIISYGYNGMPYGFDNVCEINNVTRPEVLHAETNAITKLAKKNDSSENSTLYVTTSPCFSCAKLIIQSGITSVYFNNIYRNIEGIEFLLKTPIKLYHVNNDNIINEILNINYIKNINNI